MSKAILIIDMPEKCGDCKFHRVGNCGYEDCFLTRKSVFSENKSEREDWCPLKEIPCKMIKENKYDDYADGYNACIDEMLKGSE